MAQILQSSDARPARTAPTCPDLSYKIAETRQEREDAFRLVYTAYLRTGLCDRNQYEMRAVPHHLQPSTTVFIAKHRDTVISTLTLALDRDLPLPMECIYDEEVAALREHHCLGEVICLADRRASIVRSFPVFLQLCRYMVQYAESQGIDLVTAVVHPHHQRFYQRYMDFELFGREKDYPSVCNNPAVAMKLDFNRIAAERPKNYDTFFGEPIPGDELMPQPIPPIDAAFFRPVVEAGRTQQAPQPLKQRTA